MEKDFSGTLAIDLGNTNTVIAFQGEKSADLVLIEIPSITSSPGIVPTVIWYENESLKKMIGVSALKMKNHSNSDKFYHFNFKRLIGNPYEKLNNKILSPSESGEKFFKLLWEKIPSKFHIKRLVLTAPIDTYKGYRKWLVSLCEQLPVNEVALVDEPTAAALGTNVPFGSKIMTIDIGGSTIDMNIIKIDGGEGKAAPIAELLKFRGNDVSAISKQKIRCAEIISKIGSKIGGKDIDKWIVDYFIPSNQDERNLIKAEEIKCKLSSTKIKSETLYSLYLFKNKNAEKDFLINRELLEEIIIKNNFLNHLNSLLKDLLNEARGKFCNISDLNSIILVGGGTQIPLIKEWISDEIKEIKIKYPPAIESIALGALAMTPGTIIKDILNKNISIRLFNRREKKHFWHPIFIKGQTWPTENPLKLILQASKDSQKIFEIIIGETNEKRDFNVIYENGLPKLSEIQTTNEAVKWNMEPLKLVLNNSIKIGEDCLILLFRINKEAILFVDCLDIEENFLGKFKLGSIF